MSSSMPRSGQLGLAAAAIVLTGGLIGYGAAHLGGAKPAVAAAPIKPQRKILYWYDPMIPNERYDHPGLSSMNMKTIPKYADGDTGGATPTPGVHVDAAATQALGVRLATVERGDLSSGVDATGIIDFNQRDVAIIQSRAPGFVTRVYARAPGDILRAGAPIVDLLIPTWGGAQDEFLAVRRTGDAALIAAARQRLRLLGLSSGAIAEAQRAGRARAVFTIATPVSGAIQTLDVRQGMSVGAGQTLAQVAGLATVWLNAAMPEALVGQVRVGQTARAELAAFPGETFTGKVTAILPTAEADSRTVQVRVELPNRDGRLKPGMFATMHLAAAATPALLVPSEAVIRTGKRDLVMVAGVSGHYQPVEVRIGRSQAGRTEILAGLTEGQKVVASGQFLLDSEASLSDVAPTPLGAEPMTANPR
jgi:Cu(I)/Ag(I) efflux system membrane fusion protein